MACGKKWFEHVHRCRGMDTPAPQVFQVGLSQQTALNDASQSTMVVEHSDSSPPSALAFSMHTADCLCHHAIAVRVAAQDIIRERYGGRVVGPFNEEARREAGMTPEWYMPLVTTTTAASAGGEKEEEEAGQRSE